MPGEPVSSCAIGPGCPFPEGRRGPFGRKLAQQTAQPNASVSAPSAGTPVVVGPGSISGRRLTQEADVTNAAQTVRALRLCEQFAW